MLNAARLFAVAALALGVAAAAPAPLAFVPAAFAHGMSQHTMWRSSQLVGTPVFNDQHQQIGTVTDVLVSPAGTSAEAVLSVGGFVGGRKLVAVPLAHLAMMTGHNTMMMHGATKAMLQALPPYVGGGSG
ncbi:MAG: PRC-barrel domain containing protein [Proteobacteria bacterium]|nr:PRC-barrel domain containing protein [Pseudomonadota bacterium]